MTEDIVLFDRILKHVVLDEVSESKIKGRKFASIYKYSNYRSTLADKLITFLVAHGTSFNRLPGVLRRFGALGILEEVVPFLERDMLKATEMEDFTFLSYAYEILGRLPRLMQESIVLPPEILGFEAVKERKREISVFEQIFSQVPAAYRANLETRRFAAEAIRDRVGELKLLSRTAQQMVHKARSATYLLKGDWEGALRDQIRYVEALESRKERLSDYRLANEMKKAAAYSALAGEFTVTSYMMDRIRSISMMERNANSDIPRGLLLLQVAVADCFAGEELLSEALGRFSDNKHTLSNRDIAAVYWHSAATYFQLGRYKASIKMLHLHLGLPKKARIPYNWEAHVLLLMCHLEQNTDGIMSALVQAARRALPAENGDYARDVLIIVKRMIANPIRSPEFQVWISDLQKKFNQDPEYLRGCLKLVCEICYRRFFCLSKLILESIAKAMGEKIAEERRKKMP
ncbi:MAG: hypothetical protein AAGN35_26165 [Bacteroidota bacterium]